MLRVHCVVPESRSGTSSLESSSSTPIKLHRVSAAIAKGKHPAPFRTRKLSLSAPMVLQAGACGRVGRRRTYFRRGHPSGVASTHVWTPGSGCGEWSARMSETIGRKEQLWRMTVEGSDHETEGVAGRGTGPVARLHAAPTTTKTAGVARTGGLTRLAPGTGRTRRPRRATRGP